MQSSGNILIPLEIVGDKQTPGLWFGLIIEERNCANMARDKLNRVHKEWISDTTPREDEKCRYNN